MRRWYTYRVHATRWSASIDGRAVGVEAFASGCCSLGIVAGVRMRLDAAAL